MVPVITLFRLGFRKLGWVVLSLLLVAGGLPQVVELSPAYAATAQGEIEDRPAPVARRRCVAGPNAGNLCNEDSDCAPSTCVDRNVYNITVAVHFNANAAQITAIKNMITSGSQILFDLTDGQAEIGEAFIYNNAASTSADVRIYQPGTAWQTAWWQAGTGGWKTGGSIHVGIDYIISASKPGESFAHEFTHLVFDARDEYERRPGCGGTVYQDDTCPDAAGQNSCIMDQGGVAGGTYNEYCWGQASSGSPIDISGGNHDSHNSTEQSECRSDRSCWDQVAWSWNKTIKKPAGAPDPGTGGGTVNPTQFVEPDATTRVVLVLDESTSMGTENPSRMDRLKVAASDFVTIAEDDTEVGIVSYSTNAEAASGRSYLAIDALGNGTHRNDCNNEVDSLELVGRTNIGAGLVKAKAMIMAAGGVTANTYIVLMTDGRNNEPWPQATADDYLEDQVADLLVSGIPVYVTCTGSDLGLDSQCAEIASGTNGWYVDSQDSARLPEAFVDIFERIRGREIVDSSQGTFALTKEIKMYVEENSKVVTFAVQWQDAKFNAYARIIDPLGNSVGTMKTMPQGLYFRKLNPLAGDWRLVFDDWSGDGNTQYVARAFSENPNLNMPVGLRRWNRKPGEEIHIYAYPQSDCGMISHPDPTHTINARVRKPDGSVVNVPLTDGGRDALDPDGLHSDDQARDGIFTGVLPGTETLQDGAYQFQVDSFFDVSWETSLEVPEEYRCTGENPKYAREARLTATVGNPRAIDPTPEDGFPYCTEVSSYCEKKIAQVPIPIQFWGIRPSSASEGSIITDKIRISPTWANPPDGLPVGEGTVFVERWTAVSDKDPLPLKELVWDYLNDKPQNDVLIWRKVDLKGPVKLNDQEDLTVDIQADNTAKAVYVAYKVLVENAGDMEVVAHFLNEAVLSPVIVGTIPVPRTIVDILINFDVHNNTGRSDITNFELDFHGLDFGCGSVKEAIGYVAAQGYSPNVLPYPFPQDDWGANEDNPLVVRSLPPLGNELPGTEIKWIEPGRPLKPCEWVHFGLVFSCNDFDCFNPDPNDPESLRATVQGYWTISSEPVDCDDGNPCTADGCDFFGKCTNTPEPTGLPCDDSDSCTNPDVCNGLGKCVGKDVICPERECYDGMCDPAYGTCTYTPSSSTTTCDDGNACTNPDYCDGNGNCSGTASGCDDGDACTQDHCDPATGSCQHEYICCTDTPGHCQKKVAQVPIPWQFWGYGIDEFGNPILVDLIRLSPTWLQPENGEPAGSGTVIVERWIGSSREVLSLPELLWSQEADVPKIPVEMVPLDLQGGIRLSDKEDLRTPIPVNPGDRAAFVAYRVSVVRVTPFGEKREVVARFINEAILAPVITTQQPPTILEILINFDVHNNTGRSDITNFELDFHGLDFACGDVKKAIGYIAGQGIPPNVTSYLPTIPWGANENSDIVVRHFTPPDVKSAFTEVKWIQDDRPLVPCEWLHVGLRFSCKDFDCFNNSDPNDPNSLRATVQGYWTTTEPKNCDDGNPCTHDRCLEPILGCVHDPAPGEVCDDSDKCTVKDVCDADGNCKGGDPIVCPERECYDGVCDPDTGTCNYTPSGANTTCDDGDLCTTGDVCDGNGTCKSGTQTSCRERECYDGMCDPDTGICNYTPSGANTTCDDGDLCTTGDVCDGNGTCKGGTQISCTERECYDDWCDPVDGNCYYTPSSATTLCDDGDSCTDPDYCDGNGLCSGTTIDCEDGIACTDDWCDPASGICQHKNICCTDTPYYCQKKVAQVPLPFQFWATRVNEDGTMEVIDKIRISPTWLNPMFGEPAGIGPVFVQRWVGVSQLGTVPLEGLRWDQVRNMPLIQTEMLQMELVDPVPVMLDFNRDLELPIPVMPGDRAVFVAYSVMTETGERVADFVNEAILDPNPSTGAPTIVEILVNFDVHNNTDIEVTNFELDFHGLNFGCGDVKQAIGYVAAQGYPPNVQPYPFPPEPWGADMANNLIVRPIPGGTEVKWIEPERPLRPCEWLHIGLRFSCNDYECFKDPNVLRATVQGYWTTIEPLDCNDDNPCTDDICKDIIGCVNDPVPLEGSPCDDYNTCTDPDVCRNGQCTGPQIQCPPDSDPCTDDICDPDQGGCVYPPSPDGTPCEEDGNLCTKDRCENGTCLPYASKVCDPDGNPCTKDVCDPATGICYPHEPDGTTCEVDNNSCTVGQCYQGMCSESQIICNDDNNPCTDDMCNPNTGSCNDHLPDGTSCEDGDFCNGNEICRNGMCQPGQAPDCDDHKDCTADRCDELNNDCVNDPGPMNEMPCDDGEFCTDDTFCRDGICNFGNSHDCSDTDLCTVDTCDEVGDVCINEPMDCNDNDDCTDDTCENGVCYHDQSCECVILLENTTSSNNEAIVPINFVNIPELVDRFTLDVLYDPAIMEFVVGSEQWGDCLPPIIGGIPSGGGLRDVYLIEPGRIRVGYNDDTHPIPAERSCNLVNLEFNTTATDSTCDMVTLTRPTGSIVNWPASSLCSGEICFNVCILGDVDQDEDVDIDDVYCLFKNVMGRPSCLDNVDLSQYPCADVDQERDVDIDDVYCLFRNVMGRPSCLDGV